MTRAVRQDEIKTHELVLDAEVLAFAPIAIVAALRETSVLFGALIAVVFLKEPMRTSRIVAALMIVTGLILIRLQ